MTYIRLNFFTQTLTHLYLYINNIGENGAQHLSESLKINKVNLIYSLHISFSYLLILFFYRHCRYYGLRRTSPLMWKLVWNNKTLDLILLINFIYVIMRVNTVDRVSSNHIFLYSLSLLLFFSWFYIPIYTECSKSHFTLRTLGFFRCISTKYGEFFANDTGVLIVRIYKKNLTTYCFGAQSIPIVTVYVKV